MQDSIEQSSYQSLPPTQAPINPPYKTACAMKRGEVPIEHPIHLIPVEQDIESRQKDSTSHSLEDS